MENTKEFDKDLIASEKIEQQQKDKNEQMSKHSVCSDLEIPNLYDTNANHLDLLLDLQAKTQKNVYGYDYANMSLREMMEFTHMNNHAIVDELHELTDSLGGIKDGDGSAIWKRWKKAYSTYEKLKFSDLSDSDQLEAKFEIIDILHFVFASCAMLGMDAKEVFNMYMSKNVENINRQNNGY